MKDVAAPEEKLDPDDWQSMWALGHRMVDDMLSSLQTVRERPVWQPIPERFKAQLNAPLPLEPETPEAVYEQFCNTILPHPMGNIHPRFWGWVIGTGTPLGALAEMLAAGMNPNVGGADHVATYVEQQVVGWCKAMLGYPEEASGLLVSGGSMANLTGLAVARNAKAGWDIRREGLQTAHHKLTLYASKEVHSSVQKAVELLGLGHEHLRRIATDDTYRIRLEALEEAIVRDRAEGYQPFCVVGCAGTANTGAMDDLTALADLCEREELWFHVDGAFGALAALSPRLRPMVNGMERADSLAFDLHKWLYMPMEIGCALVRDKDAHRRTFSLTPEYLTHAEQGLAGGELWFRDYGVQLSRGFRALKAWMSFKEHGIRKYGRLIEQNVQQARYLAELVDAAPELERLAPVPLNIVCFRFVVPSLNDMQLDALNRALLVRLHEGGIAVPSYTTLNGKYALRVCIVNHRSKREDFDLLVEAVVRLGRELSR